MIYELYFKQELSALSKVGSMHSAGVTSQEAVFHPCFEYLEGSASLRTRLGASLWQHKILLGREGRISPHRLEIIYPIESLAGR